jgi:hypothetical protein
VPADPKIILVAGARSADRTIALERVLRREAENTGWSERLQIRLGGIGSGAGHISDAGLSALRGAGLDATDAVCPDLERRRELFDDVHTIVCDSGRAADVLVDWDESTGAEFLTLDELTGADDDEGEGEPVDAPIARDVEQFLALAPELLRRLIAAQTD